MISLKIQLLFQSNLISRNCACPPIKISKYTNPAFWELLPITVRGIFRIVVSGIQVTTLHSRAIGID